MRCSSHSASSPAAIWPCPCKPLAALAAVPHKPRLPAAFVYTAPSADSAWLTAARGVSDARDEAARDEAASDDDGGAEAGATEAGARRRPAALRLPSLESVEPPFVPSDKTSRSSDAFFECAPWPRLPPLGGPIAAGNSDVSSPLV